MPMTIILAALLVWCTDVCDAAAQTLLKMTINTLNPKLGSFKQVLSFVFSLVRVPRIWAVSVLSISSLSIWLIVLNKVDLNLAYAFDSMRYILTVFSSLLLLKEHISPMHWAGVAAIFLGIIIVVLN
jgi:drug/metabolite transporter (DMT)-like permease